MYSPSATTATLNGQSIAGARVVNHPSHDFALVKLASPMNINGSTSGFQSSMYTYTSESLPGQTLEVQGYGSNDCATGGGAGSCATGIDNGNRVEFPDLNEAARRRLANLVMRNRFPTVEDGKGLSFDQLWTFFRETGFLFPEKIVGLEPLMKGVRHTLESLHSRASPIFKSVVCREDSRIVGHISGIRAYRNTWMMQHLAALRGKHVGQLLMHAAAEHIRQNPDLRHVKAWYFPHSRWPARVFGGFARTIADSELSELRCFLLAVPVDAPLPPAPGIEVIEASRCHLPLVESYFAEGERGLLVRADDLGRSALDLSELNASFERAGLQRRRRVLLALRRDLPLGFALAEMSSPGLNLSEVLSSFRLFILPDGNVEENRSTNAPRTTRAFGRRVQVAGYGLGYSAEDMGCNSRSRAHVVPSRPKRNPC